jgi:hypothetical protein
MSTCLNLFNKSHIIQFGPLELGSLVKKPGSWATREWFYDSAYLNGPLLANVVSAKPNFKFSVTRK